MDRVETNYIVYFHVLTAERLVLQQRKEKAKPHEEEDALDMSGTDSGEDLSCTDSDADSCHSGLEEEAEDAAEEAQAPAPDLEKEDEMEDVPEIAEVKEKLPTGSHVVHRDGYFTLVNYHKLGGKTDCKILMLPRWAVPAPNGMGVAQRSKTCHILTYDTSLEKPDITYVVLRAWALWRAKEHNFLEGHPARKKWHEEEIHTLRSKIEEISSVAQSTGSTAADEQIRKWEPRILQ